MWSQRLLLRRWRSASGTFDKVDESEKIKRGGRRLVTASFYFSLYVLMTVAVSIPMIVFVAITV